MSTQSSPPSDPTQPDRQAVDPSPAAPVASPSSRRGVEVGVLAALLAVAVAIIGFLLMRPSGQGGSVGQAVPSAQSSTSQATVKDTARRKPGDPLAVGPVDAPVVMIEYADYACPFCAKWALSTKPALIKKYVDSGKLRIEWHDLVIFGEKSQRAAQAARAAGEQGKFWEYHDALFTASPTSGHPDLSDDKLTAFAKQAGVPDLARWRKDMESPAIARAIAAETEAAKGLGANSTPVFIINGVPVVGAQPEQAFVQQIDRALGQAAGR